MHALASILLAEHNRGDAFREGFRTRGTAGHDDVLLSLLIVTALLAGMWAMSRLVGMRQRRVYNSPWKLFRALCKAHHLKWSEIWLLWRVARSQHLRDPGRLFLEGELWEEKRLGRGFTPGSQLPQRPSRAHSGHKRIDREFGALGNVNGRAGIGGTSLVSQPAQAYARRAAVDFVKTQSNRNFSIGRMLG